MNKLFNRVLSVMLAVIALLGIMIPVQATEDWVDPIPADRIILDLRAENFHLPIEGSGDAIVIDTDSHFGQAARFSYQERIGANEQYLLDAMRYVGDQAMKLRVYGGEPKTDRELLVVTQSQLRANAQGGQYITYHAEDVDLFPTADNYFLYMFDCWGFQIHLNSADREALTGQLVDMYMSLKVVGDFSVTEGNTVSYYIDRVVIATAEEGTEQHEHQIGEWKRANDYTHEAPCEIPGCGEVISEDHAWDEGVVTKEPTKDEVGIETYTCSKCQATKTKKLAAGSGSAQKSDNQGEGLNPIILVAVGLFAVAVIVIVVAIVMKGKKGKKEE